MKKNNLIVFGLILGLNLFAQDKKPNVLFIAIDDLRPELACYGKSQIISPNIDKLAEEGVVFTRAYCQVPLCGPSRLSIMTGMHPDRLGNYGMSANKIIEWREHRPNITSLPQQFRKNGYYAIGFGKIYDNRLGLDMGYSWDEFTQGWKGDYHSPRAKEILAKAKADKNAGIEPKIIRPAVDCYDTPDETYTDGSNAQLAINFIDNYKSEKPFFLAVGFAKPHLPFVAPKKYWDMYERKNIKLPEIRNALNRFTEYTLSPYKEIESYIDKSIIDDEKILELRHGYFACVSYIDAQLGKIIKALDEKGELDNTIIVLWGDHGFKLGDYGEWAKATNLEVDARVPLIVRLPNKKGAGLKSSSLIELTDVLPTLCDAANIAIPAGAEGKSMLPLMENPNTKIRDFALTQYSRNKDVMGYSLRTDKWRYTEWINPKTGKKHEEELYEIKDESLMEEKNVEKEYPGEVKNFSKVLHDYIKSSVKWEGKTIP
jgi:iduronate 2-sulfatase